MRPGDPRRRVGPTPRACAACARQRRKRCEQVGVGVDPAIAQERQPRRCVLDAVGGRSRPPAPCLRPSHSPARCTRGPAGSATNELPQKRSPPAALVADPVRRRDEHAVGDRVRALHGLPGERCAAPSRPSLGVELADRRRVEEHLRAAERGQPRASGNHWSQQISAPIAARASCRRAGSRGRRARSRTSRRTAGRPGCASLR